MLRILSILALVFSGSAFAASKTYVYPISSVSSLNKTTTAFTTARGTTVYIDCSKNSFDDPEHDWVSGFSSTEDCTSFVKDAVAAVGHAEIELSNLELSLRVTQ